MAVIAHPLSILFSDSDMEKSDFCSDVRTDGPKDNKYVIFETSRMAAI